MLRDAMLAADALGRQYLAAHGGADGAQGARKRRALGLDGRGG